MTGHIAVTANNSGAGDGIPSPTAPETPAYPGVPVRRLNKDPYLTGNTVGGRLWYKVNLV
jgi:hypothetical protein